MKNKSPRILLLDIETSPLITYTWGINDQMIGLNQIKEDTSVLSWAAKWLDEKKVMYQDNRKSKNVRNDKELLKGIWKLMDEADIIIGQNSKRFDIKRLNARFAVHKFDPPSSFKQIDTLQLAKKSFSFTSNKLEHLCEVLGLKNRKRKSKKFPGMELWKECLAGNLEAWKEMELYNKDDVLTLEDLYKELAKWGTGIDLSVYNEDTRPSCNCGSTKFIKNGYFYSSVGKFQRYKCSDCGAEASNKGKSNNLLSPEKRDSLLKKS